MSNLLWSLKIGKRRKMTALKKLLDNTPKEVYNIFKKDEGGFGLSSIPTKESICPTILTEQPEALALSVRLLTP